MGHFLRLARLTLVAAGILASTSSCAAFQMGNPFLPAARILVQPSQQILNSKITYNQSTGQYNHTEDGNGTMQFTLSSYPGDVTPGVLFTDYTIRFLDQKGTEINGLLIPQRHLEGTTYVSKGGGTGGSGGASTPTAGASGGSSGTGGSGTITVPLISESVVRYGIANGFVNAGTDASPRITQNPAPWNQDITGEITFYGQDDNKYPIQAVGTFTINFQTNIQAAGNN